MRLLGQLLMALGCTAALAGLLVGGALLAVELVELLLGAVER